MGDVDAAVRLAAISSITQRADGKEAVPALISALEEQISDRREFYNHSVNAYNVRIEQLPDLFVARAMAYRPAELFEASEAERADVEISF